MALKREVYKALEDVVGEENITDEPAILDGYARRSGLAAGLTSFVPRFEAVVLPKETKEVQAIVKLCNRHNVKFKASSTGWGFFSDPPGPGVIQLDLRRMNRILEINEKNMYAVVEPYVICAQLHAELMKRGLTCNITGAGANCSALPLAAHAGSGQMGQTTGYGDRNILAVEWVTPEGEIIELGSLASLGEWFCGDGPGPSLRGVIRGGTTPLGGLGVFTKAATKVYHWPGPAVFPLEGVSPRYAPSQIPPGFMTRYFSFPSMEKRFEAVRKIGESEIVYELMAFDIAMVAANSATSNEEEIAIFKRIKKFSQGPGFFIVLIGSSEGEFEYKKRVLEQIIAETEGKSLEPVEDPRFGGSMMWRCIRPTASIRETFRATGVFGGAQASNDMFDYMVNFMQEVNKTKQSLIKRDLILDDGGEVMGWTHEHGHLGHGEILIRYFSNNPESVKGAHELKMAQDKIALEKHYGVPHGAFGDEQHDFFGPSTSNYNVWLRKIKEAFDPNGASEATHYITAKE